MCVNIAKGFILTQKSFPATSFDAENIRLTSFDPCPFSCVAFVSLWQPWSSTSYDFEETQPTLHYQINCILIYIHAPHFNWIGNPMLHVRFLTSFQNYYPASLKAPSARPVIASVLSCCSNKHRSVQEVLSPFWCLSLHIFTLSVPLCFLYLLFFIAGLVRFSLRPPFTITSSPPSNLVAVLSCRKYHLYSLVIILGYFVYH